MFTATVQHPDLISRNLLRLTLEAFGVQTSGVRTPQELASPRAREAGLVMVHAAGDQENDLALLSVARLRAAGWKGLLVVTTDDIGHLDVRSLRAELGVDALFAMPLQRDEVELRITSLLSGVVSKQREDDPGWNGAIRTERKRFARSLPSRIDAIRQTLSNAHGEYERDYLDQARVAARDLAAAATELHFDAVAELAGAIASGVTSGSPSSEGRLASLAAIQVLEGTHTEAVLDAKTINADQLSRCETVAMVVDHRLEDLMDVVEIGAAHGVGIVGARSVDDALRLLPRHPIDVMFVASDLPSKGANAILRHLNEATRAPAPVVLLGPPPADAASQAAVAAYGADTHLTLPIDPHAFLQAIAHACRRVVTPARRVAVVEAGGDVVEQVRGMLALKRIEVVSVAQRDLLDVLDTRPPDLILLDAMTPVVSGFDLCRQIRAHKAGSNIPVLLVAETLDAATQTACLRVGADDILRKPLDAMQLTATVQARIERYHAIVREDHSVGIARRQPFLDALKERVSLVGSAVRAVGVVLLDVRGMSSINAEHGFDVGDRVLALVSRLVAEAAEGGAAVGRWGPDRFAVLVPDATLTGADAWASQIAERIQTEVRVVSKGQIIPIRVSWGTSSTTRTEASAHALMIASEAALAARKEPHVEATQGPLTRLFGW